MTDGDPVIYCKRCAAAVGPDDAFCATCGADLDGDPPVPSGAPSGLWWLGLVVHPVLAAAGFGLAFAGATDLGVGVDVLGAVAGVVAAPLAVYFDGRHLAARRSSWTPSRWYYLAVVPYLGILTSLVYLYYRHRETG